MSRRFYPLEDRKNFLLVKAAIGSLDNRSKVVKLLVDTGANHTVLPPDLLIELGCNLNKPNRIIPRHRTHAPCRRRDRWSVRNGFFKTPRCHHRYQTITR